MKSKIKNQKSKIIWVVALAVGLSIGSERWQPLALGVMAFFFLIRWLACGRPTVRTAADWPIAGLLLLLPVTLFASALPEVTWPQVMRLLVGVGFYYSIVNWADSAQNVRLMLFCTLLSGLVLALVGLLSTRWQVYRAKIPFIPTLYEHLPTIGSDTIHANVMGGALAFLLPITLAIILFSWQTLRRAERVLVATSLLAMSSTLLLTQSRGALLALAGVLLLLPLLRWRRSWLLLPLALLTVAGMIQLFTLPTLLDILTADDTLSGFDGRLEIWSRALYLIQLFPLTGVGMGTFCPVAELFYPFFLVEPGQIPHAHNIFLQVAIDLGLLGLVAWTMILIQIFKITWQLYSEGRQKEEAWLMGLGAGLLCCQVALIIHGLVDSVLWGMVRISPLVWGVWGITMAAGQLMKRPADNQYPNSGELN